MRHKMALWAICLGFFMTILDVSVVNVALANMQRHLGVSVNGIQWVVVGYTLAFGSLLLTASMLGERYGNRRIYLAGLVSFTTASLLCGLAPGLLLLVIARILQGVGAALIVPTSLGLLSELFVDPAERARATGIWGAVATVGIAAGPVIGGLLVDTLTWRSIFLVNVPVGILASTLVIKHIRVTEKQKHVWLDLPAQFTSILGLGALTLACLQAQAWGIFSPAILGSVSIGVLALAGFVIIEKRRTHPMLPLQFFTNKTFSAANTVGFLFNFGYYGYIFVISLYLQHIRHFSPLFTGLALLPQGMLAFVASLSSGKFTARCGPRYAMIIGLTIGTLGFAAHVLLDATIPYAWIAIIFAVTGFGAFAMPAMTITIMSSAPRDRAATASGILNASRQIGGSFGVAILGGLVASLPFLAGLHLGVLLSAAAWLCALLLTVIFIRNPGPSDRSSGS